MRVAPPVQFFEKEIQDILNKAPRNEEGKLLVYPGGPVSNLTERQYAQVRTESFKNRYGDWEKNNYINKSDYESNAKFRRLQEESDGMSESEISEFRSQSEADEEVRGRLSRIFRRQLVAASSSGRNGVRSDLNSVRGTTFSFIEEINPKLFHDIFKIVRNYLPNGELVDLHDDYSNIRCYISPDGLSGFAIENDGNLISVFNLSGKKGMLSAIKDYVIELGADHLDGYNSSRQPLAEIYQKNIRMVCGIHDGF